jgi:cell division protein FtsZ
MDILTVGIVTTPFNFEGKRRKTFADEGLENLKRSVDCLLIISNDKIKDMYGNLALREAFGHANNILTTAAKGIAEIITHPGYINVDFEDVKTVMKTSGVALMGSAMAEGEDRALVAVKAALASPLLNDNQILGAKNILLNISSGTEEVLMEEFEQISSYIQNESGLTAELILGTSFDETLGNKISVTLIATGFDSKPRENKVIVGSTIGENVPQNTVVVKPTMVDTKPEVVQIVQTNPNPSPNNTINNTVEVKQTERKIEEPIRINLLEEEPQAEEVNDEELRFELRVEEVKEEEIVENSSIELKIDESFMITDAIDFVEDRQAFEMPTFTESNPTQVTRTYGLNDEYEVTSNTEQDKKIERQIQRIKELKNLNITINNPQGLRDLEKEPAYLRRNKKLDDVPHSSEPQISRLSLFEDLNTGKSEIKTNNSFLHDNVD